MSPRPPPPRNNTLTSRGPRLAASAAARLSHLAGPLGGGHPREPTVRTNRLRDRSSSGPPEGTSSSTIDEGRQPIRAAVDLGRSDARCTKDGAGIGAVAVVEVTHRRQNHAVSVRDFSSSTSSNRERHGHQTKRRRRPGTRTPADSPFREGSEAPARRDRFEELAAYTAARAGSPRPRLLVVGGELPPIIDLRDR